jgi:uracil-DNA glycosylase family 4
LVKVDRDVKAGRQGSVLAGGSHRFGDMLASALGWWTEAGLDTAISETPRDWLAPSAAPVPIASWAAAAPALPGDLAAFHTLLATGDYLPAAPPSRRRIAPAGDPAAALAVVADMPDEADLASGRLMTGEAALLDAMLAAMGTARDAVYLAPLSPARATGGKLGPAAAPLAALMRTHLAFVRPKALLVLGDEAGRALGLERGVLQNLNHDGGTVAAIAIVHPRILRRTPACKAEAWAAMRQLIGVLAR